MRLFVVLCLALVAGASCRGERPSPGPGRVRSTIAREQLEAMFADMRVRGWQPESELLWGYFFTDPDSAKLARAAGVLARRGYRVVEIFRDEANPFYWLHVERREVHSVASLDARNRQFYALADSLGLASYDGMNVGRVPD